MPIKSGIGIGAAQVYDTPNVLVNTYDRLLQAQAKENAKFQDEMANLISKVKTEGARDIDKPLIAKGYDELKNIYRQASSVSNSSERNLLRAKLNEGIQSLNEAAARSAEEAKLYKDVLGRVASTGQFLYDKNKLNDFKSRIDKPITQLTAFNPLDLEKLPDDSARDKSFDNIYNELKPKAVYTTRTIGGGREQEVGTVNPAIVATSIMERIGKNPEWLNAAYRQYADANPDKEPNLQNVIDNEVKLFMARRGNEYAGAPTRIPKVTGGGESEISPSQYEVMTKKFYSPSSIGGVPKTPRVTADFDRFVTTKSSSFSPPQLESVYNISAGKDEPMKANKDVKLTGVGYVTVKGGGKELRATVVDSDNREYMLQPKDLPVSIRNEKSYKSAVMALGSNNQQIVAPKQSTPKPQTPSIPSGTIAQWKEAGWNDTQINQAVKAGKIKVVK